MGLSILIGLVVVAVAVLVLLDRRRKDARVEREDAQAVEYINLFIGTLYMVLLALVVVVMWQNVSDVSGDVRTEASGLQALVQTAQRLPAAEGQPLLKAAHEYAATVLSSEWPPKPGSDNGADESAPAARILDVLLIALAVLSLITIATPLALGLRADALAFAGFVVTTALVCLAFWFVVELQSPFHGLIHASPQPLRDALADA